MNYAEREEGFPNFRALYSKRKRVSVITDVKVDFLPNRVIVKVRVKNKKERETNGLEFCCVKKYKARDDIF